LLQSNSAHPTQFRVAGHLQEDARRTTDLHRAMTSLPAPVEFIHHPRARRYLLRVLPDGRVRVTLPRRGTLAAARSLVERMAPWIQRQRTALPDPDLTRRPWGHGTQVWYRGQPQPLVFLPSGRWELADLTGPLADAAADCRLLVENHLRRLATNELPPLVRAAAQRQGLQPALHRISIRAQRSRWGSCSRQGTLSLNWRLVQTPNFVRDYLIAHELAHLVQLNHSPCFWHTVETFDPAWRTAENWLRLHGREIMSWARAGH
jgi:predicted metal-dependent hydrolase